MSSPAPEIAPVHLVQFYEDEEQLADEIARYLGDGLAADEPMIVIATLEHQQAFRRRLPAFDVEQIDFVDAHALLARFMVGDEPDPDRFKTEVTRLLDRRPGRHVRAYGEMVDILWQAGNRDAALHLEDLWNEIGQTHSFSLLCAYSLGHFDPDGPPYRKVCAAHGGVHPATPAPRDRPLREAITERTRVEQTARRQSEHRLQLLLDSIKDYAIFMLDPGGHVVSWNPGAERMKGYRFDEIVGKHFSTFYTDEDRAAGKCEIELAGATATGRYEDESWRLRKDGSRFWANVVISAVRAEDGQLVGFAKVTRDLTERRRAEDERAARLAAEEASRAKDEFLAMLGHELRNPLAPIVTALQLARLRGHDLPELGVIARQTQHLVRLVDDLLDVPRITQGKVELVNERVEIAEVVAQAVEMAGPILNQQHHAVTIDVPRHGCAVVGDRARLAQIICNLVTNAAKYSEPYGRITVSASVGDGRMRLRVRDTGIGIEPAMLARIFDTFVQQPGSRDRSRGGLGLGLAIVRSLVQLHGGSVTARSEGLGKGSEFEVDLPLAGTVAERSVAAPDGGLLAGTVAARPRKILIIDDNVDAAELLAEIVSALGHQVRVVHDGPMALEAARELQPDLALVDIGLPVMDGYELAGHLGREPWADGVFLVAVTGHARDEDRRRSHEAGFHAHLSKPIDLAAIRRVLDASTRRD